MSTVKVYTAWNTPTQQRRIEQFTAAYHDAVNVLAALGVPKEFLKLYNAKRGIDFSSSTTREMFPDHPSSKRARTEDDDDEMIQLPVSGGVVFHDIINHPRDWISHPLARRVPLKDLKQALVEHTLAYLAALSEET